jgi:putative flippase GtrA
MKLLIRWARFNLVGAMGMVVQLAALALFNHAMHVHYLLATAAAIELTLLHNFAWHWRYTWRDRRAHASLLRALLLFHLSNGLVSMLGNLILMRLLLQQACLPLLAANTVAIVCCCLVNFSLGDRLVFANELNRLPASLRC